MQAPAVSVFANSVPESTHEICSCWFRGPVPPGIFHCLWLLSSFLIFFMGSLSFERRDLTEVYNLVLSVIFATCSFQTVVHQNMMLLFKIQFMFLKGWSLISTSIVHSCTMYNWLDLYMKNRLALNSKRYAYLFETAFYISVSYWGHDWFTDHTLVLESNSIFLTYR